MLVDTSVIVAWLDATHDQHLACARTLEKWAARETLAISSVTYAELAAGARTRESLDEALRGFDRLELDFNAAWRAGLAFRQYRPGREGKPVPPDFFIRAQAAALDLPHLTNDRRRIRSFPEVDFVFVGQTGH